jgi:uncharacterized protein YutE (UPF0331/DUF86 family)
MSNKDVIFSKINIIKNCLMAIEQVTAKEKDELFKQNLYELNLQRAIQACIDIANSVLAKEGLGLPNSYRQSFELLEKHQVISSELSNTMKAMVGFRNISVHDYGEVKPEIVKAIVQNKLKDFEAFYTVIYKRVQENWK